MSVYRPSDVELNGYRMGADRDLVVTALDMGTLEYRIQDADNPYGDDRFFGRDYLSPPTWTLTIEALTDDDVAVAQAIRAFHKAWVWDGRKTPGRYQALIFEIDGIPYQAFGRARNPALNPNGKDFGRTQIRAEFELMVPYIFTIQRQYVELKTYPSPQQGLIFPAVAPFVFGQGGTPRQGEINNTGQVPTPIRVTFYGPCSDPKVWSDSGGWSLQLTGSIAYDKSVTIDTLSRTVTRSDGANLSGRLTRRSDLSARINPGSQEVMFSANDPDGVARAVISWLPGSYGI